MNLNKTYAGNNVPKATKWIYSSSNMFRDACYNLVAMFYLAYVQFSGILSKDAASYAAQFAVIGIIVIIARIWDGLNDPIMGWIVEKCHFKMGKYKPWILIGGVTNAIVIFLMFYCRPEGWWGVLAFGLFYFLWDFTFTMNDIGYWSMLPSLTSDAKQRNNITTLVNLFSGLGSLAVIAYVNLKVAGQQASTYITVALVTSVLYLLSQVLVFFLCHEHERDDSLNSRPEEAKFTDMFKLLKTNSQLRVVVITLLVFYLGSGILNLFGQGFFWFNYGYGQEYGGAAMTFFLACYALASLASNGLFALLNKKFNRMQLIKLVTIIAIIAYILFFIYDLKIGGVTLGLKTPVNTAFSLIDIGILMVLGFIIFTCQSIFYLVLLVMMTNTIEYNEWKDGERKESQIFSLRPFTVKIADAIKQGVYTLTFVITGLTGLSTQISDLENKQKLGELTTQEVVDQVAPLVAAIPDASLITYKAIMTLLPALLFVICYFILRKYYKIDEKTYDIYCKDIEARKAKQVEKKVSA